MELLYNNTYYKFANNSLLEDDQEKQLKANDDKLTSISSIMSNIANAFAKDVDDQPSDEKPSNEKPSDNNQNSHQQSQQQQFILNLANSVHHIAEALKNIKFAHA